MIWPALFIQLAGLLLLAGTMHATPRRWRVPSQHLRLAVAGGRGLLLLSVIPMVAAVGWSALPLYWFGVLPVTAGIVSLAIACVRPTK